jgi:hypothetical protein
MGRFGDAGQPQPGTPGLSQDQYGAYSKANRFWFTYQTPNIASLAAAAAATNTIQFDNDSAFEWIKSTYTVDKANAITMMAGSGTVATNNSIAIPFVTLQIQDTGQGSYYSNQPIPVYQIAGGSPGLPYVMPAPQIIAPNASLQFNWLSYSTAGGGNETYTNLRFQLHGWKILRGAG